MANLLTGLRLLAAAPFFVVMQRVDGGAPTAACLLAVAILTDLLDGPLARRRGTASSTTELFDHAADVTFVTAGLAAAAARGAVNELLPILVPIAFVQYALDSRLGRSRKQPFRLEPSVLGRWNGILYFVPLVGDVGAHLGLPALAPPVRWISGILVLTTLASIADRARRWLRRSRGARGSLAAGTGARSPR